MSTDPAAQRLRRLALALGIGLVWACAQAQTELEPRGASSTGGASGHAGGGTLPTGARPAIVSGGTAGALGTAGTAATGLVSDEFGASGGVQGSGGSAAACDYETTPGCDWSRIDGCCSQYACERASADPWDTYPVDSCTALVECVQANDGCSTPAAPLCFTDGDDSSPCLEEGYQASHQDPDGPFAWTETLVGCVCGF